jgi:hypothetical protein
MTGQLPPGWYRDPYGTPGLQRYWDGSQWTQATQPTDEWDDAAMPTPSGHQPPDNAGQHPQGFDPQGQHAQQSQQPQQAQPEWAPSGAAPGWGPAPQQQQQYGWQPAPGGPPQRNNTGLILGIAGGAAALVVLLIMVAVLVSNSGGDPDPTTSPTAALTPAPTAPTAPVPGRGASPVIGTTADTSSGLSYPQLGGTWERARAVSSGSGIGKLGFVLGSVATVQRDYDGPNSRYVASVISGALTSTVSTNDLETAAKRLFTALMPTVYPQPNTKLDLESKTYSVSGKKAWYYKVQLRFPQAQAKGWNFGKETIVVVTVERGSGKRPATFYVSVPDSHENQGDIDLLLNSLKVQ